MKNLIDDALIHFPKREIGNYSISMFDAFIEFSPKLQYRGEKIGRLLLRPEIFKHYGIIYTLKMLFLKLIPSIENRNYEEKLHPEYERLPSAYILSITADDLFPNVNANGIRFNEKKQYRSHNIRVSYDEIGPYLDWAHLGPISKTKYTQDFQNQARDLNGKSK